MQEKISEQTKYIEKVRKLNEGKNLKYIVLTMGCQLNENDSEKISGMLEEMGYSKTDKIEDANVVAFNTCCVRENAEDRLFGKLGEVKKYKETNGTIIAIGGCMMQEKHIVDKLKHSYPFFDIVFGTHTLYKFPEDIYNAIVNGKQIEDIIDIDGEVIEGLPIKRDDNIKASVAIMNGCNNFCTYCIVPYVRGRERSRKAEDIIAEVKCLAKEGYKEITLLGQNVNSYMRVEREQNLATGEIDSFAKLLREVNKIDGIERIRFISPHPKDFTDDVIEAIRDCEKVCKIIHLPLQSGSTEILKRMNRKYTKEQYLALVDKMKAKIPGIVLSTDIIVGFPGETEDDFEDTLDVVRQAKFDSAYTFIYSKRTGTPAARMENQVPEDVVKDRFNRLLATVNEVSHEHIRRYEGMDMKVLVEGKDDHEEGFVTGRMTNNILVHFAGDESLIGQIVTVHLDECKGFYYMGRLIED